MADAKRVDVTAEQARNIATLLRQRVPSMDHALLDDLQSLADEHPSIDVLDAFCDGVAAMASASDDELSTMLHRLSRDMDFAAASWPPGCRA